MRFVNSHTLQCSAGFSQTAISCPGKVRWEPLQHKHTTCHCTYNTLTIHTQLYMQYYYTLHNTLYIIVFILL